MYMCGYRYGCMRAHGHTSAPPPLASLILVEHQFHVIIMAVCDQQSAIAVSSGSPLRNKLFVIRHGEVRSTICYSKV